MLMFRLMKRGMEEFSHEIVWPFSYKTENKA